MTEAEIADIVAKVLAELGPEVNPQAVNLGMFSVAPGQTILADHMNSALQTGIAKFANAAARDAQWPAPPVGAMCYVVDVNYLMVFDNQITGGLNAWHVAGGLRMGYATVGGGQSIPRSAVTLLGLGTASGAANRPGRAAWNANGSVTLPVAGTYLVNGNVTWPTSDTTGERMVYIQRYAAGAWTFSGCAGGANESTAIAVGGFLRMGASAMISAAAGEQVGMLVQHSAATALTLPSTGTDIGRIAVHLLGAD